MFKKYYVRSIFCIQELLFLSLSGFELKIINKNFLKHQLKLTILYTF